MPTTRKEFVDSNVWVYANDAADPAKRDRARALISELSGHTLVVSTQVMLEFYSILHRRLGVPAPEARSLVQRLTLLDVVETTPSLVMQALDLAAVSQLSHWDAMILTAAAARRCSCVWTEDMNHGQRMMGVEIRNPFKAD